MSDESKKTLSGEQAVRAIAGRLIMEGRLVTMDQMMEALFRMRTGPLSSRFANFLGRYEVILFPLLGRYGWTRSPAKPQGYLDAFDAAFRNWFESHSVAQTDEVILAALPNGTGFIGPRSNYEAALRYLETQRFLQTGSNIAGGLAGTVGYFLWGDAGSDFGALIDTAMGAAGRTGQARAQFKALSRPPAYRPEVAQIAPASRAQGSDNRTVDNKGTGNPLSGPAKPIPPPPSPSPMLPTPLPAAPAPPASTAPPAGGGKPPSGAGGPPPGGGKPPPGAGDTIAKLRGRKIDVDDAYTRTKLTQIYGKYDNPETFMKDARAGIGELRVIVNAAKEPEVKLVRFLRPVQGQKTPDIEVEYVNKRPSYIEVRTMTEAPSWARVKHGSTRGKLVANELFIKSLNDKIRLGQLSPSRPGKLALHAPFETVTPTALDGWRDLLRGIIDRFGPIPPGVNRIEVSGGTGNKLLIFQQPDWNGVIVH